MMTEARSHAQHRGRSRQTTPVNSCHSIIQYSEFSVFVEEELGDFLV